MKGGYKGYAVQRDDPRASPPVTIISEVNVSSTKRTRKRTKKDQALSLAHEAAQGTACEENFAGHQHDELCRPGVAKSGGYLGNVALSNAVPVAGNSPDVPDYNARRAAGGPGVATYHRSLQQHSTDVSGVLAMLRTQRGGVQDLGFGPDSTVAGGYDQPGQVTLHDADFCAQAGSYRGLVHHPLGAPVRPDSHPARLSATPPNPAYPTGQAAASRPPMSAKVSNLDVMKATMRVIGG